MVILEISFYSILDTFTERRAVRSKLSSLWQTIFHFHLLKICDFLPTEPQRYTIKQPWQLFWLRSFFRSEQNATTIRDT